MLIYCENTSCFTHYGIFISVKQNLRYVWLLGPHVFGKLIHYDIFISVKQNLRHAWLFGPHALGKLTPYDIFISVKQNLVMPGSSNHMLW